MSVFDFDDDNVLDASYEEPGGSNAASTSNSTSPPVDLQTSLSLPSTQSGIPEKGRHADSRLGCRITMGNSVILDWQCKKNYLCSNTYVTQINPLLLTSGSVEG